MPTDVTISSISGSSPFDIYVCDTGMSNCIYVDTITSGDIPYVFETPSIFFNLNEFNVKIVDNLNCMIINNVTV
jgi:hypothetical protein